LYRPEFFKLAKLAIPLIVAQLAQTTLSFVDTLMVGQLGNDALAGIALGSTIFFLVYVISSGVILGVSPIVSQAVGGRDFEKVGRAARQGLWLSMLLGIPAFLFFQNSHDVLIALNQHPDVARDSSAYLKAISWGIFPGLAIMAMRGLLEGHGDTPPIMVVAFIAVGLNVLLNNVLMFGWYGLPALGLVGTGYSSSLVLTSVFSMLATYILWRYNRYQIFQRLRFPDPTMMLELLRVGTPIALTLGFECSMFSAAGIAMGTLGKFELAAHQIALQTASVSFTAALGLAIAASVRVGQAIGRGDVAEARVAGHVGMLLCLFVMGCCAVGFWLFPKNIIGLYLDIRQPENQPVLDLAIVFLAIAALFQIVDGLQVAGACALRGLKDTFASMILSFIAYWGIGATAGAWFCFGLGWGGKGLWFGMTLGLAAAAILLAARFEWKTRKALRSNPA
jgi:MATE family multidrug resistance protein